MKNSKLFISILIIGVLFSTTGCGVRIDTPEGRLPTLDYPQTARLQASLCAEWGLKSGGKTLGINKEYWDAKLSALGKPDLVWFPTSKNKEPIPLPPAPIATSNLRKASQILKDCGTQAITDAEYLSANIPLTAISEIKEKVVKKVKLDKSEEKLLNQEKLVQLLFTTGISFQLKAESTANANNIVLSNSRGEGARKYQYSNKHWNIKSDSEYAPKIEGKKEKLKTLILSLDKQRFKTELALSKSGNQPLNSRMSSYLNPVILRQIDSLIEEYGSDPRLAGYQISSSLEGTAPNIYRDYIKNLLNIQFQILLNSPAPEKTRLEETTVALLKEMEYQGEAIPSLPGLEARSAVVTDSKKN